MLQLFLTARVCNDPSTKELGSEIEEDVVLPLELVQSKAESASARPQDGLKQISELAVKEHLAFVQKEKQASTPKELPLSPKRCCMTMD